MKTQYAICCALNESPNFTDSGYDMAQLMKRLKTSLETTYDFIKDNIQRTKNNQNNSFSRFSDDLTRVLLSHNLPLEDRFRFECVSKQFQRTVFENVVDIMTN
ncbi:unnamed protein product [Medioppia subpectinata]|uniref:Uncharacterized protein n=1 Tax=Medioppia subpectinata TaxID=1979941 RepID=A0A7R9KQZ8_9ACAR|nr:unnamed protein product [Medioppia subpectinata]CAG2108099.1 unnamed protein product [Medioppia subpectinata]